jgi:hypothetical protein
MFNYQILTKTLTIILTVRKLPIILKKSNLILQTNFKENITKIK